MPFLETLYGLLFATALFSALMVVLAPHAVYNALFLVVTMVSISILFVLMNAQLAGMFQIIVYAGAIMVLFLFVLMLLNIGHSGHPMERNKGVRVLGIGFAVAFVAQLFLVLHFFSQDKALAVRYNLSNPKGIEIAAVGRVLETDYIYAFAMTSILLLVAMIGAVVMARRHLIQGTYDATSRHEISAQDE